MFDDIIFKGENTSDRIGLFKYIQDLKYKGIRPDQAGLEELYKEYNVPIPALWKPTTAVEDEPIFKYSHVWGTRIQPEPDQV